MVDHQISRMTYEDLLRPINTIEVIEQLRSLETKTFQDLWRPFKTIVDHVDQSTS